MCWIYDRLFSTEDETTKAMICQIKSIPTMTIGDIIQYSTGKNTQKITTLEIGKCYVGYYCEDHISINGEVGEKLIDSLFEMLKWCIKENYIDKESQFNESNT